MLVDTHCHLDSKRFADPAPVIQRAVESGVGMMINNGIDPQSNRSSLQLSRKYRSVMAALGLHPSDWLAKNPDSPVDPEIEFIRQHAKDIVAVGEIGLDYYWVNDEQQRKKQVLLFRQMLKLAEELGKPAIVHSRGAEEETLSQLSGCKVPVVLHSFSGSERLIAESLQRGYYLSVPAKLITDPDYQHLASMAKLTRLLTETDAPYQSPLRGKLNEPANIRQAVAKIAEIKGLDALETEHAIFANFQKLFLIEHRKI